MHGNSQRPNFGRVLPELRKKQNSLLVACESLERAIYPLRDTGSRCKSDRRRGIQVCAVVRTLSGPAKPLPAAKVRALAT